jgi:2-amino-4-hydroxy-6-hydroxymethyldihydropteridine diphosphokinase
MYTKVLVALGGNQNTPIGPPARTIAAALSALQTESVRFWAASRLFRTPAFPTGSGPDYVNAAAVLMTDLAPEALLAHLHGVETIFGRVRHGRWGARTLDIDLIACGAAILPDQAGLRYWIALPEQDQARLAPDRLILPHPRVQDRAFVLVPLADIAPGWCHPLTGRSVTEMLADLPDAAKAEVRPL